MLLSVRSQGPLRGSIKAPGNKSISHRALMLAGIARGTSQIRGLLASEDVLRTASCLQAMGVTIDWGEDKAGVTGRAEAGLRAPEGVLDAGNSGTTMRLLMGLVASCPISVTFSGDVSLSKRPMDRIAAPLMQMGALVQGQGERCLPPVTVRGGNLQGIEYCMPVASAQIKSAILLAGLRAEGKTCVHEPGPCRDHTERMLADFGVAVERSPGTVAINGGQILNARDITVPGDISSVAYAIVAAALVEGSSVEISQVGLNPTRTGLLEALAEMGADVACEYYPEAPQEGPGEPCGVVRARYAGRLRGCQIAGDIIPRLLDELPVLAVAAACAEGDTTIRDAQELRVKESDRIATTALLLEKLGVDVEELPDGMIIHGRKDLKAARIDSAHDHRIAMSAAVAGLVAGEMTIDGAESIATSYPGFVADMSALGAIIAAAE